MRLRQRQAIPPTMSSVGYVSDARTLCAGPADSLTGPARYREVYHRARQRYGVRVSLRCCWYAYRYGVCLSGSPQPSPLGSAQTPGGQR